MTAFNFQTVRYNNAFVSGVRNPNFQRRETKAPIGTDGTVFQTSNAVIRTAPMASFDTIAVRALVDLLDETDYLPVKSSDGANGLEMLGMLIHPNGPGYESDPTHAKRQMTDGTLFLNGLSYTPGDVLVASLDFYGTSADGEEDPVTVASNVALPTLPVNEEQLVLTSLVVGGLTITKLKGWSLSIGHKAENNDQSVCYSTGLPHPVMITQAGVNGQAEISMTVETLDLVGAITSEGTAVAEFQTINPQGVGVSGDTTTVTVRGLIREESIEGQPGGRRIIIDGIYDGTNLPLTIENA